MSHSSYTASERRGIIAIGLLALLIIGCGLGFSFCNRSTKSEKENLPVVEEFPEMIDSVNGFQGKDSNLSEDQDNSGAGKSGKRSKSTSGKSGSNKNKKNKKTTKPKDPPRRRSPLDEPV